MPPRSPKLSSQVDCYLIKDDQEVANKAKEWEEVNKEYLEKQAAKAEEERLLAERAEAEAEEGGVPTRPRKHARKGEPKV